MPTTVSCLFALVIEINGYKELLLRSKVSGAVQIIMMQNHFADAIMEYLYSKTSSSRIILKDVQWLLFRHRSMSA